MKNKPYYNSYYSWYNLFLNVLYLILFVLDVILWSVKASRGIDSWTTILFLVISVVGFLVGVICLIFNLLSLKKWNNIKHQLHADEIYNTIHNSEDFHNYE